MMVEMGTDRVHHAFWQYMDPAHHRYEPGNPFESVIADYYDHVDGKIGELLEVFPEDTPRPRRLRPRRRSAWTGGSPSTSGCPEGLPRPARAARRPSRLEALKVDWAKTTAWGSGGYYGRLFLNVKGREPQGLIDPAEDVRGDPRPPDRRARGARRPRRAADRDPRPQARGPLPRPSAARPRPTSFVYFGDLRWRSVGTVGDRPDPHLRERHRPRRRQPRPRRDLHASPGRARRAAGRDDPGINYGHRPDGPGGRRPRARGRDARPSARDGDRGGPPAAERPPPCAGARRDQRREMTTRRLILSLAAGTVLVLAVPATAGPPLAAPRGGEPAAENPPPAEDPPAPPADDPPAPPAEDPPAPPADDPPAPPAEDPPAPPADDPPAPPADDPPAPPAEDPPAPPADDPPAPPAEDPPAGTEPVPGESGCTLTSSGLACPRRSRVRDHELRRDVRVGLHHHERGPRLPGRRRGRPAGRA